MYKQALIIRNDLKMGKGKIAAQASHASISAFLKSKYKEEWLLSGQKKIVLKADLDTILKIFEKAKKETACALIKDAGLTQIPRNTITALGIGPDKEEVIDKYIKDLKLL